MQLKPQNKHMLLRWLNILCFTKRNEGSDTQGEHNKTTEGFRNVDCPMHVKNILEPLATNE